MESLSGAFEDAGLALAGLAADFVLAFLLTFFVAAFFLAGRLPVFVALPSALAALSVDDVAAADLASSFALAFAAGVLAVVLDSTAC